MKKLLFLAKKTEYIAKVLRSFIVNDEDFLSQRLKEMQGSQPNLTKPSTLNEKICYRMIHQRNPLHTILADKIKVREYVKKRTDLVAIIPIIKVYNNTKQRNFDELTETFVLKCNHDSGSSIICTNKKTLNKKLCLKKLELALFKNMYYSTREWHYKNIEKKIICEEYVILEKVRDKDPRPEMLRIHCFNGIACFIEADFTDSNGNEFINVYDRKWKLQPFQMEYPNYHGDIVEPDSFYKALTAAQEISSGIDYCRVDLMLNNDKLYFSEITLTPCRGKLKITPEKWDRRLGEMWELDVY